MIILQGFYWNCLENWWNELNCLVDAFEEKKFDQIWLPPSSKGMTGKKSMGYDISEHYNLDSRFGNQEELKTLINNLHDRKIKVMGDLVMGHLIGGDLEFNPLLDKETYSLFNEEKFPKNYNHFCHHCGECDSNNSFGETICYYKDNSYMKNGLINWAKWLREEIGYDSFRLDNLKDIRWDFTRDFSNEFKDTFLLGEYWDHNDNILNKLSDYANIHLFNFPLYYPIKEMCMNPNYNISDLKLVSNKKRVNFLVNHDIERDNRENMQAISINKELGYAYILMQNAPAVIFWNDYFKYELKDKIDQLMRIRKETTGKPLFEKFINEHIYIAKRGKYEVIINNGFNSFNYKGVNVESQNYKVI
jgi:alpha-amylase